jgi:hypothetical protein
LVPTTPPVFTVRAQLTAHHLFGPVSTCSGLFFIQVGATSAKDELDALGYGGCLRQSDRNMPKSKFNVGITGGKLMAKEYEGVLLLLATIVRSSAGRKILQDTNLGNFNDDQIADWLLLLETLLGWVQWLKSEKMQVKHVDASSGNIDIMFLVKSYP